MLNVPVRIKQNRSSPTIPGSPINAQLRKYRHSPFTIVMQVEYNFELNQIKSYRKSLNNIKRKKNLYIVEQICLFLPFCRILRHIVGLTPGKCSKRATCLQSVIDNVLLSNGSAHFGSESDRHSQHFMQKPIQKPNFYY